MGSSDGIIIKDSAGDFFFLTNTAYAGNLNGNNGELQGVNTSGETFYFMAGTMIRRPDGEVAIERLRRGDLVCTQDGRVMPVEWLGMQTVSTRFADKLRVLPIRIRAGALADSVPARDLLVSPDHAILVEGCVDPGRALINGTSIIRESDAPQTSATSMSR